MPTKVILIRHGLTQANKQVRYCGHTDVSLSQQGIRQLKKLSKRMASRKVDKIYCSDLKRTVHSAKLVFNGSVIVKRRALREINFGIFEGLTHNQLMRQHPLLYQRWLKKPLKVKVPKAESFTQLKRRVKKELKNIVSKNKNKTIAIVTHAGPIKILISDILKTKDIWAVKSDSSSLHILEFSGQRIKIILLNDISHLKSSR